MAEWRTSAVIRWALRPQRHWAPATSAPGLRGQVTSRWRRRAAAVRLCPRADPSHARASAPSALPAARAVHRCLQPTHTRRRTSRVSLASTIIQRPGGAIATAARTDGSGAWPAAGRRCSFSMSSTPSAIIWPYGGLSRGATEAAPPRRMRSGRASRSRASKRRSGRDLIHPSRSD